MALKNSLERLTIGQLANLAGMGIETIRFYERKGIITRPARPASGFRVYSKDVVARLTCVREAQEMGFTLREIIDLLALRDDPSTDAAAMRGRATAKLAQIQNKIDRLESMRSTLQALLSKCPSSGGLDQCSIAAALSVATSRRAKPRPHGKRRASMKTAELSLEGMHCDGCAKTIEALLTSEPGVKTASVSFANGRARVMFDPGTIDLASLVKAVERAGYRVSEQH